MLYFSFIQISKHAVLLRLLKKYLNLTHMNIVPSKIIKLPEIL